MRSEREIMDRITFLTNMKNLIADSKEKRDRTDLQIGELKWALGLKE